MPQRDAIETPLILTLDVGTSSVRALLFDRRGRHVEGAHAGRAHEPRTTPDGGAEMDAEELLQRALSCAEEVLQEAGDLKARVAGVAISTYWHSMLGVDAEGRALTPIYLWADTRSVREVEELRGRLDERACHARTGCVFHTSYLPARLLWVQRHSPPLFRSVRRWMSPGEYFLLRLLGKTACSVSMASGTGLFNHARLDWDEEMLSAAGLQREQLSPLVDLDAPLQGLTHEFAQRLPALRDALWFPALGDGACSNVGCGGVTPDRLALMVGTTGAMRVMRDRGEPRAPFGLWCYRPDGKRFLLGGALSNGGSVWSWMQETLKLGELEEVERQLAAMEADAHGLTVLPFLAGERCPGWRGDARAAIVGLSWNTQPMDILRAGLESVAFRFALIYEMLQPVMGRARQVIATGGALLRSPTWMQMMADVLGEPVVASEEPEGSSRGAALLALEALGALPSLRDASFAFGTVYQPDPARHERYRAARERQRGLYEMLV